MKKWLIVFAGVLLAGCNLIGNTDPSYYTYPVVLNEIAIPERPSANDPVTIIAQVGNQYGSFQVQVIYDVVTIDAQGVQHTDHKEGVPRTFAQSEELVEYLGAIPRLKSGSTVYWQIKVTNERGLSTLTDPQNYTVR